MHWIAQWAIIFGIGFSFGVYLTVMSFLAFSNRITNFIMTQHKKPDEEGDWWKPPGWKLDDE